MIFDGMTTIFFFVAAFCIFAIGYAYGYRNGEEHLGMSLDKALDGHVWVWSRGYFYKCGLTDEQVEAALDEGFDR